MAAYDYEDDDDDYFVVASAYEDDDDGFVIAASEEEDDDYIKVITTFVPPPLPLPASSSYVCAAAAIAASSPAPYGFHAEEHISPSPAATHCVDDVHDAAALWPQQDDGGVAVDAAAQQGPTPVFFLYRHREIDYEIDDEEETDDEEEDEDDYMYQGYYDLADRGRARHVKRSSGRRGRTKKASTMGRPRGDARLALCSGNL